METQSQKLSFLRSAFGNISPARDGVNIAVTCPACESGNSKAKKKFSIDITTWRCHCWVCGIKSSNLYFILKDHISKELASQFRNTFNIRVRKSNSQNEALDEKESVILPEGFILLAADSSTDPDVRACKAYLSKRGVTNSDMWYFKIGAVKAGRLRRRIIIPSFDQLGLPNYFVCRSIDDSQSLKYLNSKNKKSELIFNEININWDSELTLVEGPFDLFKSNQNATCLLGSKLSKSSRLFKKIATNRTPVLLALDPDMKAETQKIASLLSGYDVNVRVLETNDKKDVGDMSKEKFALLHKAARTWTRSQHLKFRISSIGSGSLFR